MREPLLGLLGLTPSQRAVVEKEFNRYRAIAIYCFTVAFFIGRHLLPYCGGD